MAEPSAARADTQTLLYSIMVVLLPTFAGTIFVNVLAASPRRDGSAREVTATLSAPRVSPVRRQRGAHEYDTSEYT